MTLGGSPSKPPCKKPALVEEREPVLQTDDRREEEMLQEEEETSREVEKEDSSKNSSPPEQPPSCKTALETDDRREEEMEQEEEETSREVEKEDSSNNTSPPKQPPTTREPALKTPTGREVEMMESRVSSSKALNKRLTRRELQNLDTTAPAPKVLDFCAGGAGAEAGEGEEEQVKYI